MRRSERSVLRWSDTLIEAAAAIAQRPVRTLLTALGTILGVGTFVTTTGMAATASAQVSARFDALAATEVRVQDDIPDGTNPFPDDVDRRLSELNGVNQAGIYFAIGDDGTLQPRSTARREADDNTQPVPVVAASPGALRAVLPVVGQGLLFDTFHENGGERVAVIGRVAAEQLGITHLDNQPAIYLEDTPYLVIGIIDDVRRNPEWLAAILVPTSTATMAFSGRTRDFEVIIDTQPGAAALAGRQAPLALRPDNAERLRSIVPPDPKSLRNDIESDVTNLYYSLAALALIIGTIAIANATLLSTIERRPEIGLRRALGATRFHIVRQITLEAAITGTIAGIVGTAIAITFISTFARIQGWGAVMNPTIVAVSPGIGLLTGAVAGIVPALRAARIAPAITLRS